MKHEITLTQIAYTPETSEVVGVEFDWNGTIHAINFGTAAQFYADNADIIQTEAEACRVLLFFALALGETIETLPGKIGKKLTIEVGPTVQQVVSFA